MEIPGQPQRGARHHIFGVNLQSLQIQKRVNVAQFTGVDQAHVDITCLSTIKRFVEHRIFAVKNRSFEGAFTNVVVQGRACLAQEQRQRIPMHDHVAQRLAHGAIGFDLFLPDLILHPL